MTYNLPIQVERPVINIQLPPDTPLLCDIHRAAELFSVSESMIYKLVRSNKDFPKCKVGAALRFPVPDLYAWFRDYPGGVIPTD